MNEQMDQLEMAARRMRLEETAANAMSFARTRLVLGRKPQDVFFATMALRLEANPNWDVPTMATDGRQIIYNPEFTSGLSPDELLGVLVHEVLHITNKHHTRQGSRDGERWNNAADCAINHLIVEAGYTLPKTRLMPGEGPLANLPKGLSAEAYYPLLPQQPPNPESPPNPDPGGTGGVQKPGDGSPAACALSESQTEVQVAQAASLARQRGALPAGMDRLLGELMTPKVDWVAVLREFISVRAKTDYRWCPPSRRYVWQDMYLPSVNGERLGKVVVAFDTSGSIGHDVMRRFGSEIQGILDAYEVEVTILYHDSEVAGVQTWESGQGPLVLQPKGGGGTDHRPVFDHIDQENLDPVCLVALTDCYTCYPDKAPEYPVLWCVVNNRNPTVPFGDVLKVD